MTDEFMPPADNQPVMEDERSPAFVSGSEPAVYAISDQAAEVVQFKDAAEAAGTTFLGWLRGLFGSDSTEARTAELTQMIESYPETAANYVFRGELLLKRRAYEQAADDFRHALELTTRQVRTAAWGLVAQALQDRALVGLEQAQRRLPANDISD